MHNPVTKCRRSRHSVQKGMLIAVASVYNDPRRPLLYASLSHVTDIQKSDHTDKDKNYTETI